MITLHAWIIPLIITIGAFIYANKPRSGYFGGLFEAVEALIIVLIAWLIYFIIY